MKKFLILFLLMCTSIYAQKRKSVNEYKYVIVPHQFEFFKKPDRYQTSSLTKFLFNKHGFTAFLSNENLPKDLSRNRCLALTANVKDNSGMFATKNTIELRNCNNDVIYTSKEGVSKQKEYKKAYHEAIRRAFTSIQSLNYTYKPSMQKEETPVLMHSENNAFKEKQQVKMVTTEKVITLKKDALYAQPKENGYQLVNTKPEVVFNILTTNVKDVYIIKGKNGILYKSDDVWIAEFYKNGNKVTQSYSVKF